MSTWYYMLNGAQTGPVTTDELNALIASGTVRPDTIVWRQGMAGWIPANQAPDLIIPVAAVPVVPVTEPAVLSEAADIEKNKIFGVISYLPPLLFIVPLIAARESKFAMYHCNQGAILTITAFILLIGAMVLGFILAIIPILGVLLSLLIHLCIYIAIGALAIIGLLNAANGRSKPLPVIGNLFTLIK